MVFVERIIAPVECPPIASWLWWLDVLCLGLDIWEIADWLSAMKYAFDKFQCLLWQHQDLEETMRG
jgi:hypothetical protein